MRRPRELSPHYWFDFRKNWKGLGHEESSIGVNNRCHNWSRSVAGPITRSSVARWWGGGWGPGLAGGLIAGAVIGGIASSAYAYGPGYGYYGGPGYGYYGGRLRRPCILRWLREAAIMAPDTGALFAPHTPTGPGTMADMVIVGRHDTKLGVGPRLYADNAPRALA